MAFASQAEYRSFKILGSNSVLPKLYGTCGPAYFVENTQSLSFLNYVFFRGKKTDVLSMKWNFPPWSARAEAALSILKMVREMEDPYDTILQNCDIQPHNLGLSGRGDVVILDSDSLRFGHMFDHHPPCQIDSDCALLTCLGKCNQSTKSCVTEMTSTNLQIVCRNIFATDHAFFGLLRAAPPKVEQLLKNTLQGCMYPKENNLKLPKENKFDRKMMEELQKLLQSTL